MKRTYLHLLLLVICGVLVYANALSGPFIFDDIPAIGNNPDIRQLWPPDWAWPDSGLHAATNSRPLTSFTLALNYALNGFRVEGYHLVNIALHILCGLALYGVVRRLCGQIDRLVSRASELALASALLWLVHPLNSQVVNYTIQRSESLMALCYLGTLYCFLRGVVEESRHWLTGAVLCCALGMAAKEVMVSAPLAVLLVDGLFVSGAYRAALLRRAKFYAGLALSWLVLLHSLSTIPHGATIGFGRGVDVWTYLLNQTQMITIYLRLALWPHPLSLDYGYARDLGPTDVWLEGLLVLAWVVLSGVAVYRRWRWGLVGALALLVLAPTSSFVPIVNEVGAERRFYLPLGVLIAGLVVGGDALSGRWSKGRRVGLVLVGAVALVLGWSTQMRNRDYASAIAIWQSAVTAVADNPRAAYNLANRLKETGDAQQAMVYYRQALTLNPDEVGAHNNLGQVLVSVGAAATALDHYHRALELNPNSANVHVNLGLALEWLDRLPEALSHYRRAVELDPASTWARYNLGVALEEDGQRGEAITHYRWALETDPKMGKAHYRLGLVYAAQGRWSNAAFHLRQALVQTPDHAAAHLHLGQQLSQLDSIESGIAHYRRAVELDPDLVEAHYYLGTELIQAGQTSAALPHLHRAVELAPELAAARNNLGIALQRAGRRDEAVIQFRRALALRPDYAAARDNLAATLSQR